MVAQPYVNHVPTMTGGIGFKDLRRFYADFFIPGNPPDMTLKLLSRTVGTDRVVDEMLIKFTHTVETHWMLPGVPPTGKKVEVVVVGVVCIRGGKLYHEHIHWDQATVLVQVGLLDPAFIPKTFTTTEPGKEKEVKKLPVVGPEGARKVVDEHQGKSNELINGWRTAQFSDKSLLSRRLPTASEHHLVRELRSVTMMADTTAIDIDLPTQEILLAASQHDIPTLRSLISTYANSFKDRRAVDVQDPETFFTPLHAAIASCETEDDPADGMASAEQELEEARSIANFLLEEGAIWNQLDVNNETPGCVALRLGLGELYQLMVDAGVRAELLLNRLEARGYEILQDGDQDEEDETTEVNDENQLNNDRDIVVNGDGLDHSQDVTSKQYLSSALSFSGDKLLDEQQNGVMMAWEKEIMHKSADGILYKPGLRVLNIGFGMGIIDTYIQGHANAPSQHHIVEAHPDVLEDMKSKGWNEKSGVTIHEGKWQDILPELVEHGISFDAVYFDTFAESYAEFRDFFSEQVIGLLEQGGKWSFFNGMGADRQISYDIYQKVVEMDLFEAGFDIDWKEIEVPDLDGEWEGVKRSYFNVKKYRLPLCRFMD